MARFFINRPIFAWVIAIVVMLSGSLSLRQLPVEQYPRIAPPAIAISANYPGASARTVEESVTQIIEQQMSGLDGLLYMSSTSQANGTAEVTLTFSADTNPDIAQVQVQNKLQGALPTLPESVQQQGIRVNKASRAFLMVVALINESGSMSRFDLADYAATFIQDPISRVQGVGQIQLFGANYAMRIWLDPYQLANYGITVPEVATALATQNVQVSAGQLGGLPALPGQQLNATVSARSLLQTPEQFGNILLRTQPNGAEVRLKQVSRIELGTENYSVITRYNGMPASGLAIQLASGENALETAERVRARMNELAQYFPPGVSWVTPYDTTPFIEVSIEGVYHTLLEAIVLVFLVMFLFLQNWRATLIPTIAVPVVLLGTFGVLAAFGFTINSLTMFGLVLAIGLLVDDAIVVVENVERIMAEEGLSPIEATRKSMDQITGALIGIALVLSAVFVPMAFLGGSTGLIYRQFSITIVSAMALSVLVALVLTPALCATLLRPAKPASGKRKADAAFASFNRWFDRCNLVYQSLVRASLRRRGHALLVYVAVVGVLALSFSRLPTSFLPDEDQGVMITLIQLPVGATQERTDAVVRLVEQHFAEHERDVVASVFAVNGFSFAGRGQNMALVFTRLIPWQQRKHSEQSVTALQQRSREALAQIKDAVIIPIVPPSMPDLGSAAGFELYLQDANNRGHVALINARNQVLERSAKDPRLTQVRANGLEDQPEYQLNIDYSRAAAMGISAIDINATLTTAWGGRYINDFIDKGRIKKVYLQGDAEYRMNPEDFDDWYLRSASGEAVSFASFTSGAWSFGSPRLERFNGVSAVQLQGSAASGYSSGEAMNAVIEHVKAVPGGWGYAWSGASYQERLAGTQGPALYALSIIVVFLCLAALYESWSIPLSVLLALPLGVVGAVLAVLGRGMSNDIFFQVGLLTTIGLSAKNAILIVEFAKDLHTAGMPLIDATVQAARLRLRPIVMTSVAFMLGVTPLALSSGAGAGGQNAIGTSVLGGMLSATLLVIVFVPLFFVLIIGQSERRRS